MAHPKTAELSILSTLIGVAEKAGNIARICRQDDHLLSLLVREKSESEKNPRYVHDFKTLADVLVQEVVKHELCSKFPVLNGYIFGEESNEFELENECVTIEVKSDVEETCALLSKILLDPEASKILAEVVHSETIETDCTVDIPELPDAVGVWIDPIDSTAEFIGGKDGEKDGRKRTGLPCVTILIGVFDRNTGEPIMGIINQPFYTVEHEKWRGRYVYGICINDYKVCGPECELNTKEKVIAVSSSENDDIKHKLSQNGFSIAEIAGAGYKIFNIIIGEVCGYVLSKPTTYMWDICAGHAILKSIGGDIIEFTSLKPLKYKGHVGVKNTCNDGGIIAFRDVTVKEDIIESLNLKGE